MSNSLKHYLRQLSKTQEENKHILPWGSIVLRNCDQNGDLLTFKSIGEYKKTGKDMWLQIQLLLFRENDEIFPIFQCPECPEMKPLSGLALDQIQADILPLRCIHSQAATYLADPWDYHWAVEVIEDSEESHKVECNLDIKTQELRNDKFFLAAYQHDGEVSLLFTVSANQKYPFCSKCSSKKCKCFRRFKKEVEDAAGSDEETDHFWKRMKTDRPGQSDNFHDSESAVDYQRRHGYNKTRFYYPIKRNSELRGKFLDRMNGHIDIPAKIVPKLEGTNKCESHGNAYNPDNLVQVSPNIKIFTETSELIQQSECFGLTAEGCKCILQADTHKDLLWNLGSGKFICYTFLHSAIHKLVSGTAINAIYSSRATTFSSLGVTTSLTVQDLTRAVTGFAGMLRFMKEDFLCDKCGDTPAYIVCDGKSIGPAKRKVNHLSELDRAEEDNTPLQQGSQFSQRVFLSRKSERDLVKNLLNDQIDIEEFLDSEFSTENGRMVHDLVSRISGVWPDQIPAEYRNILASIAKYTSVAGYLQVLSDEPLQYLALFCQQQLNLRSAEHRQKLNLVMSCLRCGPIYWTY